MWGTTPTHVPGTEGLHPALARQFRGMKNAGPGEKQEKALPVCVYHELHRVAKSNKNSISDLDSAVADILALAYFFCMRSCEYLEVQGERRTKLLCVRKIQFFNDRNQDVSKTIAMLHSAVSGTLTFEFQKRDVRNDTISHQ
jgi:hypothetical protein